MSKDTCARCSGSGSIECPSCDGSGRSSGGPPIIYEVMTLIAGDDDECSKCDGTGEVACPVCHGSGKV